MIEKDSQGRGWELKYAFYVTDELTDEEAQEFMEKFIRKHAGRYSKVPEIVDWDGPL